LVVEHDKYENVLVGPGDLLTEKIAASHDIGLGDDCFIVGRFINHEGKQKNRPSLRFGNIAQMPGDPLVLDDGSAQEGFLVEARSISGYSGSPVFVEIRPFAHGARPMNSSGRGGPWLLGIDFCHVPVTEKIYSRKTMKESKTNFVKGNSGMMGVIPAWRLLEMMDYADVKSLIERQ